MLVKHAVVHILMKITFNFPQELCVTHFSASSSYSFLDNDLHLGDALGGGEYSLVSLTIRGFFLS